jgi:hypothetical protein
VTAFSLFVAFVVLRRLGLDDSGPYSAPRRSPAGCC